SATTPACVSRVPPVLLIWPFSITPNPRRENLAVGTRQVSRATTPTLQSTSGKIRLRPFADPSAPLTPPPKVTLVRTRPAGSVPPPPADQNPSSQIRVPEGPQLARLGCDRAASPGDRRAGVQVHCVTRVRPVGLSSSRAERASPRSADHRGAAAGCDFAMA